MSFIFEHWFEDEPADITKGELKRIMNNNDTKKTQGCHEDTMKVLEKIKAEIEEDYSHTFNDGCINKNYVLSVIDKYKTESEDI